VGEIIPERWAASNRNGGRLQPGISSLIEAGFTLRLISSLALARTREALHNGWDKNDPKDAQVILRMLRIGASQVYCDPLVAGINDLQELSKTHEVISKAKTELWHRLLTHYLPVYFPEIARFAGNSRSDWFLAFLERFPTRPASRRSRRRLSSMPPGPSSAGKSPKRLLGDMYETARSSIGVPVALESPAIAMFRMVIAEARSLIRQRNEVERQAEDSLPVIPITTGFANCQVSDRSSP
jgi:hypothetical protein